PTTCPTTRAPSTGPSPSTRCSPAGRPTSPGPPSPTTSRKRPGPSSPSSRSRSACRSTSSGSDPAATSTSSCRRPRRRPAPHSEPGSGRRAGPRGGPAAGMRVVVVGSGGREAVLAEVLGRTAEVVVTPGNPGIPGSVPTPPEDLDADLFVIGPEVPLVDGLADQLRAAGKRVYGPGADGARLEGSKARMKEVVEAAGVATARRRTCTDADDAIALLCALPAPWVVQTDGLAAGQGVLVTHDRDEAEADVRAKLAGSSFGDAGRTVVIEEGMTGPEVS